jgi:DNA-binding SARP family transcriptional activator
MHVLRLCGAVTLTADDNDSPMPLGGKSLALLSVLVLEPRVHQREALVALLWGESPDDRAKASLRQALTRLRGALGDTLHADRSAVSLSPAIACDVTDFLRLAQDDPWSAIAIDIPRFLEGLTVRDCPAFDEWVDNHRSSLTRRYLQLLAGCVRDASARRQWADAIRLATRWHELAPLADEPVAALIEAHFLAGDAIAARSAFGAHAARLEAEGLGAPGQELVELAARVQRDTAAPPQFPRVNGAPGDQGRLRTASLVGRETEWAQLRTSWEATIPGRSHIVIIEGEPGAGKTRLADDFARWAAAEGGLVLRGRGQAGPSLGVLVELLGPVGDAPAIAGVAPEWLAEVARIVPPLRTRFSSLPQSSASAPADSWRLFEGIAEVLVALAEDDPVVILVDDLHRCDADSCDLLRFLARRLGDAPVLWCTTFTVGGCERDAPAAQLVRALRAAPETRSMTLPPLDEESIRQIVRELGDADATEGDQALVARIHEATAGTPYYIMALLEAIRGRGPYATEPGDGHSLISPARFESSGDGLWSPTLHSDLAERIECLPDELREILISVAVSGRGCSSEVLSHLHGISRLRAAARVDALVERQLAEDVSELYRCSHPVIARAVRQGLGASRRREVHRAFALTLELIRTSPPGSADDGEIALHADQAGERALAVKYAMAAGEGCAQRGEYDDAEAWRELAERAAASDEEAVTLAGA